MKRLSYIQDARCLKVNLICISTVAEFVMIRICEPKREVLTETWKVLHKEHRNLYYTRYVVTAIKFKMSYMGGTYSTRDGGEQFLQNFNQKNCNKRRPGRHRI